MSNFKPGDTVVCVNRGGYHHLTLSKQYVVESVTHEYVRVEHDKGRVAGFLHRRFELVMEVPMPPVPQSTLYLKDNGRRRLAVSQVRDKIHIGILADFTGRKNGVGYSLTPNDALDVAHDLIRMAMEQKRKQEK